VGGGSSNNNKITPHALVKLSEDVGEPVSLEQAQAMMQIKLGMANGPKLIWKGYCLLYPLLVWIQLTENLHRVNPIGTVNQPRLDEGDFKSFVLVLVNEDIAFVVSKVKRHRRHYCHIHQALLGMVKMCILR
jgi:hypothetical protein